MGNTYCLERFEPYLNDTFEILTGETESIQASLIKACPIGTPDHRDSRFVGTTLFSLIFRVPGNVKLNEQTFTIKHEALGALPLFLVSIGSDAEGDKYETIFT